jgi:hypothetical protein
LFLGNSRVWTQGLTPPRQVLYCLNHTFSPHFLSVWKYEASLYISDTICLLPITNIGNIFFQVLTFAFWHCPIIAFALMKFSQMSFLVRVCLS